MTGIIDKSEICKLIPHSGSMCLLDKIIEWDDKHITCDSNTHQDIGNPLRNDGKLAVTALIEYGAQAMAIHGGLLAKSSAGVMQEGYLAALRDVNLDDYDDVSDLDTLLCIEATQLIFSQGNMIYNFSVKANEKVLVSGRATVVAVFRD